MWVTMYTSTCWYAMVWKRCCFSILEPNVYVKNKIRRTSFFQIPLPSSTTPFCIFIQNVVPFFFYYLRLHGPKSKCACSIFLEFFGKLNFEVIQLHFEVVQGKKVFYVISIFCPPKVTKFSSKNSDIFSQNQTICCKEGKVDKKCPQMHHKRSNFHNQIRKIKFWSYPTSFWSCTRKESFLCNFNFLSFKSDEIQQ